MRRNGRPGIDKSIEPMNGVTALGQPLSYNRAASPDLSPWISRLYATVVEAPDDYVLSCGLLNDTSFVRIQLRGEWHAETVDGPRTHTRAALVFGPQSRRMPIRVRGSFISIGISLRPGTGHALFRMKTADHLDRIVPSDELGLPSAAALDALEQESEPERWLQRLEDLIRLVIAVRGGQKPDPVTARFEAAMFYNPNMSIREFADDCGVTQRSLERIVRRDFGMAPKQVLRRARALDMASYLRGVADNNEAEELALRYYDQSHLIREFVELFGMAPSQFVSQPQPLLTLTLESRQARRLEALERIGPGAKRPWE